MVMKNIREGGERENENITEPLGFRILNKYCIKEKWELRRKKKGAIQNRSRKNGWTNVFARTLASSTRSNISRSLSSDSINWSSFSLLKNEGNTRHSKYQLIGWFLIWANEKSKSQQLKEKRGKKLPTRVQQGNSKLFVKFDPPFEQSQMHPHY